jgi:hypothetical protein
VRREQEGEAERDEAGLRDQVENRDHDPVAVESRSPHEAERGDDQDRADADDDVPRLVPERVDLERRGEVVRHEQRRERDHDQVVEKERPAGQEPSEVVERPADEGRGAAGLRNRGRALRVRERHDEEEPAHEREHDRRQAERVEGDDPERDVDRRRDLAVGDGEERGRVEDPLESGDLARHVGRLLPAAGEVEAACAEGDEQHADEVADTPAVNRGLDDQRDAEADGHQPERDDRASVHGPRRPCARQRRAPGTGRS